MPQPGSSGALAFDQLMPARDQGLSAVPSQLKKEITQHLSPLRRAALFQIADLDEILIQRIDPMNIYDFQLSMFTPRQLGWLVKYHVCEGRLPERWKLTAVLGFGCPAACELMIAAERGAAMPSWWASFQRRWRWHGCVYGSAVVV